MPNRLIKESLCTSERISQLSDFHFRLWACLITYVDDYGRGDARAAIIKGRCFPLRDKVTVKDIEAGLHELATVGCIVLYRVDDGLFLCFPNWEKHQTVRNQKSKYPSPDDGEIVQIADNCKQLKSIACKSPRNPIQSESESNPNPNPKAEPQRKRFVPPSVDEVRAYCMEQGSSIDPQTFVDFYAGKDWMVGKTKMVDWKACVRTWESRERNAQNAKDTVTFMQMREEARS